METDTYISLVVFNQQGLVRDQIWGGSQTEGVPFLGAPLKV